METTYSNFLSEEDVENLYETSYHDETITPELCLRQMGISDNEMIKDFIRLIEAYWDNRKTLPEIQRELMTKYPLTVYEMSLYMTPFIKLWDDIETNEIKQEIYNDLMKRRNEEE